MLKTLVTVLMLALNPMDGLAPLRTTATVTVDRRTIDVGRACLIWINETAADGLPKSYIDCWDIWPTDSRTSFEREVQFPSQGVYAVWAMIMGQDKKAKAAAFMTPIADVVTK